MASAGGTGREEALAWAAECRRRRAGLEDALGAGELGLADALGPGVAGDDQLGLVKVLVVLEALPAARKVDTRRRLAELGIDGATPLRDLTDAQRHVLLATFPLPRTAAGPVGAAAGAGAGAGAGGPDGAGLAGSGGPAAGGAP